MYLPDQYGVYEQEKGINSPTADPYSAEYDIFVHKLFHIENGLKGFEEGVDKLKKKESTSDWAFWFSRNRLLDSISFFLRIVRDGGFDDIKNDYRDISKLAYETLKSTWFNEELKNRNLVLESSIQAAIEDTYNESRKLDRK